MRAAIFDAPHAMHVGEWETPRPGPGEVVVTTRAIGICAGDMYIYQGKNPYASYPVIGGHEIAGLVTGFGEGVTGLREGELVVVEPFIGCGKCYPCRIGKRNCCANLQIVGAHRAGGFAEQVLAPAQNIHRVPAGMSATVASFAQPLAVGGQACRRGPGGAEERRLVLGPRPHGTGLHLIRLLNH